MDSSVSRERRYLVSARVPSHFKRGLPREVSVTVPSYQETGTDIIFCFNTCAVHLVLFCTVTNKCTIISQIITLLHLFININQLDALNFIILYFKPLHVSSTCAHRQEGKILLYSLWYHHNYRWPSRAQCVHGTASYRCDDTRDCIMLTAMDYIFRLVYFMGCNCHKGKVLLS